MESVTLRGLDVTCHFRLDQSQNLPVDQCHDLSSKPAAPRSRNATTQRLQPFNKQTRTLKTMKQEAARAHIFGETQDVVRKMNQLLRHERPHRRMESVTPRRLDVTCYFWLDQREILAVDRRQDLSSKPAAPPHSEHNEERNRPHTHQ